jgi:hypothetical protein
MSTDKPRDAPTDPTKKAIRICACGKPFRSSQHDKCSACRDKDK